MGWGELFKIRGCVLKCTEFRVYSCGKGVFTFGKGGIVVFSRSEFCVNSVEFTGCLFW